MNDRYNTIECLKYLRDRAVIADGTITEQSYWIVRLCDEVLELLKYQEPRVLTLEEVKKLQSIRDGAIWLETFGNGLFPALPEFSAEGVTFFVAILFDGYRSVFDNDWYGKTWRCWSARPTDEQREAVPWQE